MANSCTLMATFVGFLVAVMVTTTTAQIEQQFQHSDQFNNDDLSFQPPQQEAFLFRQRRQQPATGGDPAGGFLSGLNNLAQQAQQMSQAQQLFQSAQSLFNQPKQTSPSAAQSPAEATVKSALDTAQTTSQSALSGAQQTALNGQMGMRSALTELSAGLQKLAQNNPNLLPDVKGLYQRVSSQLSTASAPAGSMPSLMPSSNPIVPANTQNELTDNLAKLAAMPGSQASSPGAQQLAGVSNLLQSAFSG